MNVWIGDLIEGLVLGRVREGSDITSIMDARETTMPVNPLMEVRPMVRTTCQRVEEILEPKEGG